MSDSVVVIGGGPAGLMAGLAAQRQGARVRVLAKGWGVFHWHAGCVDVLGYHPVPGAMVTSPRSDLSHLIATRPDHPYALVGVGGVSSALDDLRALCAAAGYPLVGSIDRNRLIPTGVGAARPTCLVPETMAGGDLEGQGAMLIVGFERFPDLTPTLVADNLGRRGIAARGVTLDLASLRARRFVNGPVLASLFETEEFRAEVTAALLPRVGRAVRVGFPAVLGHDGATKVVADLRSRLGVDVFEIPVVPPSIPGMRLHRILAAAIRAGGGRVHDGMEAVATESEAEDGHRRVTAVLTEAAARNRRHTADAYVLATGGILGGGIVGSEEDGLAEVVFGLPVAAPAERSEWLRPEFTDPAGHPVYRSGVVVDGELRPLDPGGSIVCSNLHAAGGILAGADPIAERSVDGIALATGRRAGLLAARSASPRLEGVDSR